MKKLLLFCVFFYCAFLATAQTGVGRVNADIGAGYAVPTEGFGVKPGVTFVAEPHYFLSNNFSIGIRFEGALLGYQAQYNDELFSFFGSSCATGEYHFGNGKFRPFLGAGGGLYTRHYIFEDNNYDDDQLYVSGYGTIKLGFFGRAGFEAGHIRIAATYNTIAANFSYAAFTVAYVIGE
ncbi:MAG: hypothetical protein M3O71_21720 [Bacteroidota bacterium]|nr:hypothetical protein [Bacteroidota bacterium]